MNALISNISVLSNDQIKEFLEDIDESTDLRNNLGKIDNKVIATWKLLYENKKEYALKDWNTLVQFGKLNDNVKVEIVQFTDASATKSTLIKFCNDLKNTNGFIDFLNNPNHLIYANGFLGYRNDSQHNHKPEDYEVLTDEIVNLGISQTLQDMIGSWLDHAVDATNRNGYYKKGKDFENWIKGQLSSNTSATYQQLKTYFTTEGWNLDDCSIYSQVYFCINGSTTATCTDEDSYFIADFVFVKEVVDPVSGNYLDVKIADTKLSAGTRLTKNQNNSKVQSKLYIRTVQDPIKGSKIDLFQKPKDFINSKIIYKIYSGGTTTTYGGITK